RAARSRSAVRLSSDGAAPCGGGPSWGGGTVSASRDDEGGEHHEAGTYCRLPPGNSMTHCPSPRCPYRRTTETTRPTSGWPGCTTIVQPSRWSPLGSSPAFGWSCFDRVHPGVVDRGEVSDEA